LTAQKKAEEIVSINQQLNVLEEQVNNAKTEIRKLVEKRNKLNEQFKGIREEIRELRTERDNLNEKVQTLKMLRDEIRTKTRTIIEKLKAIGEKITELRKNTPERRQRELQKELDSIEWTIQTTSLDLKEEKKLIENVKNLEMQLVAYRKIEKQKKKAIDLRRDLKALDEKAALFHQELSGTAQKSQEIHQKMLAKIDESKKIKLEADSLHSAYLQAKEKADPVGQEWRRLMERRKKLQDLLREDEEKKRKNEEQVLKEKLGVQAREKLQRGEKLSWEEFQLLSEEDSQTQD
jgi:uncharacterized coiled-coil DUF342 family protein